MVVGHPSELDFVSDIGLHSKRNETENTLRRRNNDVLGGWRWCGLVFVGITAIAIVIAVVVAVAATAIVFIALVPIRITAFVLSEGAKP